MSVDTEQERAAGLMAKVKAREDEKTAASAAKEEREKTVAAGLGDLVSGWQRALEAKLKILNHAALAAGIGERLRLHAEEPQGGKPGVVGFAWKGVLINLEYAVGTDPKTRLRALSNFRIAEHTEGSEGPSNKFSLAKELRPDLVDGEVGLIDPASSGRGAKVVGPEEFWDRATTTVIERV
jgi:hypothetical protein